MSGSLDLTEDAKKNLRTTFKDAGKKDGLKIFRIENFEAKAWNQPGKFFDGDCYIVLKTTALRGSLVENYIHFWIGSKSSQDEQGAAALNAFFLDEFLGGGPIQVREEQGFEGARFLSYFKDVGGIEILQGGAKSGFKSAARHKLESRLYRVKGRSVLRLTQMALSVESLNSGDVFILDTDSLIYVWVGSHARRAEVYAASNKVDIMRNQTHGGKCQIEVFQEGSGSTYELEFYQSLGHEGSLGNIGIKPAADDDEAYSRAARRSHFALYRIHKEPGQQADPPKIVWEDGDDSRLSKHMLDKYDAFVLFTNEAVYAWSGTHDTLEEKKLAFKEAQKLVKDNNLSIPVYKVYQHMEPGDFTQHFPDWFEVSSIQPRSNIAKTNPHASTVYKVREPEKIGIKKKNGGRFSVFKVLSDDDIETGEYDEDEINSRRYALTVDDQGRFGDLYSENCYLMFYEDDQKSAVFYWLGRDASQQDRGICALIAKQMDDEHAGKPIQIRQVQGRETDDLLQFFQETIDSPCRLLVHRGKDPRSGRHPSVSELKYQVMFEVIGTQINDTSAYEVEYSMGSLNSNNCFIIKNGHMKTLWYGKYCNGDERDYCKKIYSERFFPNEDVPAPVLEGSPTDTKWKNDTFGSNQMEYFTIMKPEVMSKGAPKLYQLSNAAGYYELTEIPGYQQMDLIPSDVMILITDHEAFVWHGAESRKDEQEQAVEETEKLMEKRSIGSVMYFIKQGNEPHSFKSYFDTWDNAQWEKLNSMYKDLVTVEETTSRTLGEVRERRKDKRYRQYSMDVLMSSELPDDVDPGEREKHLSPKDFFDMFNMDINSFLGLPKWKQNNLKKEKGFF